MLLDDNRDGVGFWAGNLLLESLTGERTRLHQVYHSSKSIISLHGGGLSGDSSIKYIDILGR